LKSGRYPRKKSAATPTTLIGNYGGTGVIWWDQIDSLRKGALEILNIIQFWAPGGNFCYSYYRYPACWGITWPPVGCAYGAKAQYSHLNYLSTTGLVGFFELCGRCAGSFQFAVGIKQVMSNGLWVMGKKTERCTRAHAHYSLPGYLHPTSLFKSGIFWKVFGCVRNRFALYFPAYWATKEAARPIMQQSGFAPLTLRALFRTDLFMEILLRFYGSPATGFFQIFWSFRFGVAAPA